MYLLDRVTVASPSALANSGLPVNFDIEDQDGFATEHAVGYITPRGSICNEKTDSLVGISVAKEVARVKWDLETTVLSEGPCK